MNQQNPLPQSHAWAGPTAGGTRRVFLNPKPEESPQPALPPQADPQEDETLTFFPGHGRMFACETGLAAPALVLTADQAALGPALAWLRAQGVDVFTGRSFPRGLQIAAGGEVELSMLLVDADSFGGLIEVAHALQMLREEVPDLRVLLYAEEFRGGPYSTDYFQLCDAALQAPLSTESLDLAITEVLRGG